MKKIIILLVTILTLSGCQKVNDLNYDEVLKTVSVGETRANTFRTGYKYYLPRGMKVNDSKLFNEVLTSDHNTYYLYIDAISYYNEVSNPYTINNSSYYSRSINYGDKYGYVEINLLQNEKYLIEIMYNYAKIEVIVDKEDVNKALLNAISILKNVKFNDAIITNLLEEDVLNFVEEEFNIFNTTSSDSTYIQIDDTYEEVEDKIPDTDLIN